MDSRKEVVAASAGSALRRGKELREGWKKENSGSGGTKAAASSEGRVHETEPGGVYAEGSHCDGWRRIERKKNYRVFSPEMNYALNEKWRASQ